MSRPIQIAFQPGAVYGVDIEGPEGESIHGSLRVHATSSRRVNGKRVHTVVGEIIENGQPMALRFAEG